MEQGDLPTKCRLVVMQTVALADLYSLGVQAMSVAMQQQPEALAA